MPRQCKKPGCSHSAVEGKKYCAAHLSKRRNLIGKVGSVVATVLVTAGGVAIKVLTKRGGG